MLKQYLKNILEIDKKDTSKIVIHPDVESRMYAVLSKHIPQNALDYCFRLWKEAPFHFKISKARNTCLGNYTFRDGEHKITINNDLNIYSFLVTYIHEIAHQRVWMETGRKEIQPHGREWKEKFQILMTPLLSIKIFPENILIPLIVYLQNPAASSLGFAPLAEALKSIDEVDTNTIILKNLENNHYFEFRGQVFQKIELRRTRVLCVHKHSKKRYTILASARVSPMS